MAAPFELFVAWRYLRQRRRRKPWLGFAIAGTLLVAAGIMYLFYHRLDLVHPYELTERQRMWKSSLQGGFGGSALLAVWVLVFAIFHRLQSIFTTISTFGVYLGTSSLVVVLSVMNGFEADLRRKIIGSNAHLLITRAEGPFTEWHDVEKKIDGKCAPRGPCVVAHTPYVSSEVVIAADSNYQPVVIKGIDPKSAPQVTDLARNLSQGSIENLWPQAPDAGVSPDAGAGEGPIDFSAPKEGGPAGLRPAGGEAERSPLNDEPQDFSVARDAGLEDVQLLPPRRPGPRPLRPDPRVASLDGVLVGRELARNLRLYEGEEVQVISPLGRETPTGQVPRTRPFRVAGIFYTGMYEYDAKIVYVSVPALQSFLSLGDEVTGIELKASDVNRTQPLVAYLQRILGPSYQVKDWVELNKSLFAALKLEQIAMFLVLTIIILVASFSIITNLIMVVIEKAREIAILKSMGASNWAVMRIFVSEGLYIGLLGTSFGIVDGLARCWFLAHVGLPLNTDVYYIDRLPVALNPPAIVAVAIAGILISIIATVYPAWVGARLRPVDGLRR